MTIGIQFDLSDIREAKRFVRAIGPSGAFITSHMITQLLPKARKYLGQRAKVALKDGATRWTTHTALRYEKPQVKKDNTGKIFWVKDAFYMEEVIRGGKKKGRNKFIPEPNTKKFRLDKYGNIPQNFQQQVSVRSGTSPHNKVGMELKRKHYLQKNKKNIIPKGSDRRFKGIMLIKQPFQIGNQKLPAGIYRRNKKGNLDLLIAYKRQERFNQRKPWEATEDVITYFNNNINNQFRKSFAYWNRRERMRLQRLAR